MLEVLRYPDARLRNCARPVTRIDTRIQRLARQMLHTMYEAGGIGLAAPQVGHALQLVVLDVSGTGRAPQVLVNPRVLARAHPRVLRSEGCLSLPGIRVAVARPTDVLVQAQDLGGRRVVLQATGLLAACLQHELDHLAGRLIVDSMSTFA